MVIANGENVAGGAGLTKEGAGALIIDRASSYTGATTINGGTLQITGSGGEWAPGLFYINNASTLELASQLTLRPDDAMTFDSGGGGSIILHRSWGWNNDCMGLHDDQSMLMTMILMNTTSMKRMII